MIIVLLYWFSGIVFALMVAQSHTTETKAETEPWMWIIAPVFWALLVPVLLLMILRRAFFASRRTS